MPTGRISFAALLIASIVVSPFAIAHAETVVNKSITYFSIGGRTAEELDKALSENGPMMKSSGSRHPGATKIKFGGTVTYVKHGNRCIVGSAKVTLSTRLILPRWKNRPAPASCTERPPNPHRHEPAPPGLRRLCLAR